MTRCVHCLVETDKITDDHVLPKSWYPENTPLELEKWTVPSCLDCNKKLGAIEDELRIMLSLHCDPSDPAFKKMLEKTWRSVDPRSGKNKVDSGERAKRMKKLKGRLKPISPKSPAIIPNLGAHPSQAHLSEAIGVLIDQKKLHQFGEKMLRGLYYRFEKKYVREDYEVDIFVTRDEVSHAFDNLVVGNGQRIFRGKGLELVKAVGTDDPRLFCCIILIWGRLKLRGTIAPRKTTPEAQL